jgi:hypothetical protein
MIVHRRRRTNCKTLRLRQRTLEANSNPSTHSSQSMPISTSRYLEWARLLLARPFISLCTWWKSMEQNEKIWWSLLLDTTTSHGTLTSGYKSALPSHPPLRVLGPGNHAECFAIWQRAMVPVRGKVVVDKYHRRDAIAKFRKITYPASWELQARPSPSS